MMNLQLGVQYMKQVNYSRIHRNLSFNLQFKSILIAHTKVYIEPFLFGELIEQIYVHQFQANFFLLQSFVGSCTIPYVTITNLYYAYKNYYKAMMRIQNYYKAMV